MKKRYLIVAAFAMMFILIVCMVSSWKEVENKQTASEKTTESHSEKKKLQIGVSFDSFILERWQRDRDVLVSTANELGADVNVQNANGSLSEQVDEIEYFIEQQVDVIILVMVTSSEDTSELRSVIKKAQNASIPVIAYDRLVLDAGVDYYISFDNEEVGRLMAQHMKEHLGGSGTILQICGPTADNNVAQVMTGFSKELEGSDLTVTETDYAEGWMGEMGFQYTSSYLAANEAPSGIMCGNDSIAGNTIRSLSENRLAGSVCVVGQDADLDACQRIVEGTQCMTVYKPVEKLAQRAAELAVDLAGGVKPAAEDTINDGSYDVPYEKLSPIAVTKDNMDEEITGIYHEEDDIYLNVR